MGFLRVSAVACVIALACAAPATAQDIFTTKNYRQDRALWTNPAYYRNNTVRALVDMAEMTDTLGKQGTGADGKITTPYPYKTSQEHYDAWLKAANGGTKHTLATLPDWDGRWRANQGWLDGTKTQASTVAAALTPQFQEYFVQQEKAEIEGRGFWPAAFCLPRGFGETIGSSPKEFAIRPDVIYMLGATYTETPVRWVYMNTNHTAEAKQFAKWHGESIGFWDGDSLVIHTNQIRQWKLVRMFEWSDQMSTVERYRRVGDRIEGEIIFYDPVAFRQPLHAKLVMTREQNILPELRSSYATCTDSNGPSANVFINDKGLLNERLSDDPLHWDSTDPRPWAKLYAIGE